MISSPRWGFRMLFKTNNPTYLGRQPGRAPYAIGGRMSYQCPVCGFPGLLEPARSPRSGGGSYEICPSCGFEFGVSDDDKGFMYEQWREKWVRGGMPWRATTVPPPNGWDPKAQLQKLLGGS